MTPDELEALLGIREIPVSEVTPEALLSFNEPDAARARRARRRRHHDSAPRTRSSTKALLHNDKGIWDDDVLADAKTNVRNHFGDPLFNTPANRTIGLVIAGDDGKASHARLRQDAVARARSATAAPAVRSRGPTPRQRPVVRLPDQRPRPALRPRSPPRRRPFEPSPRELTKPV